MGHCVLARHAVARGTRAAHARATQTAGGSGLGRVGTATTATCVELGLTRDV